MIGSQHEPDGPDEGRLKAGMWGIFGVLALLGLATPNPWLTAAAMLASPLLFWLLWRPGEPPILAFAAGFQWLQAASPVLAADVEWRHMTEQPFGYFQQRAAWLSLLAVVALGMGMAASVRRMPTLDLDAGKDLSRRLSTKRLFIAYIFSLFLSVVFTWVSSKAGGLRQPILALASIKWVPLFLLFWSTLQWQKPKRFMIIAVCIEVVIGFSGFFSSFKSVLFLLLIVASGTASDQPRLPKTGLAIVTIITLLLVSFWQAVKVDYRNYLNQGSGQQVVLVPFEQRMRFLVKSATRVTPQRMVDGAVDGVKRLGYINYFAHSIRNVPKSIPHQNGKLWIGAVKHVFMPRILFPKKPELNDSERTNYFTGLNVAGAKQGTSISIGYVGESYIDFGKYFMLVPVFLLGYLFGTIYKYFATRDQDCVIGFAVATSILLFSATLLETSNIKLVGGIITSVLSFAILQKFARDWFIEKVLPQNAHQSMQDGAFH